MKKALALILALSMTLSLAACTSSNDTDVDTDVETEVETETTEDTTGDDTEIPGMNDLSGEQAVAPSPEDDFTENAVSPETVPEPITPDVAPETPVTPDVATPAVTPAVTTPDVAPEIPAVTPEETAPTATEVTAQSIYDAIIAANAEFPANMLVEGEFLDSIFPGLADASTDFVVYMPMMSAVAAEIAIAKNDGTSTVADLFQARIDYQVDGGAFYPETTEGWNTNSHIVTVGDYVMLLACPAGETAFAQAIIDLFTATVG